MDRLILYVAQGFGVGRIPAAPGTFGSVLGLLWLAVLVAPGELWVFLGGIAVGLGFSVWLCGAAERILQQPDPGSIVLDEITAVPLCFLPWVVSVWVAENRLPAPDEFFSGNNLGFTLLLFVLFRLFDVLKPWPVGQSQRLPGGWGVTADDVLAAVYVALISLAFVA